jgi:hypothetical protein
MKKNLNGSSPVFRGISLPLKTWQGVFSGVAAENIFIKVQRRNQH